jgi:hypothetical protein
MPTSLEDTIKAPMKPNLERGRSPCLKFIDVYRILLPTFGRPRMSVPGVKPRPTDVFHAARIHDLQWATVSLSMMKNGYLISETPLCKYRWYLAVLYTVSSCLMKHVKSRLSTRLDD